MNRRSFLYKGAGTLILGSLAAISLTAVQPNKNKKFTVIPQRCDGCGHCYRACKDQAISEKERKAFINFDKCKGCGDCTRYCRRMAIVEHKA
jgi:NAD-dependent dihydropyrimidine dehydrogenase PreA subunit